MVQLRRTDVAGFDASRMVTLDELNSLRDERAFEAMDALCGPINSLPMFARFELTAEEVNWVLQGQSLIIPAPHFGDLALVDAQGQLVALGAMADDGRVARRDCLERRINNDPQVAADMRGHRGNSAFRHIPGGTSHGTNRRQKLQSLKNSVAVKTTPDH